MIDAPRHQPRNDRIVEHRRTGPAPSGLAAHGGYRSDAGEVDEREDQKCQCRCRRKIAAFTQGL